MDIMVVFKVMMKLFLILILGFVLNRKGILDTHSNKSISSFIVNISAPFLIICSVASSETDNRSQILLVLGIGFVMYLLLIGFAVLFTRIFPFGKDARGTIQCMIVFSNNAFLGYPVVSSVFGAEAVFYTSMLHFSYNIFIYTYGVLCLSGNKEKKSVKEIIKTLVTPGLILMIASVVIYLFRIPLPQLLYDTMDMIGDTTSPLSMIILGSTLAAYPLRESLTDLRCYGVSLIRLIAIPLLTLAVCRICGVNEYMTGIAVLTNAMPVGSMVVMFANQYDGNSELAARGVLVTTTLSMITIPVMAALL